MVSIALLAGAVAMPSASVADAGRGAETAKKRCKAKKGGESAKRKKCKKKKKKKQPAPASLTISPTSKDFGMVDAVLTSAPQTFTVTNTGGSPSGTLTDSTSGPNAVRFVIGPDTCEGAVLAAGASCALDVTFSPMSMAGPIGATLNVSGSPGGALAVPLSGISTI